MCSLGHLAISPFDGLSEIRSTITEQATKTRRHEDRLGQMPTSRGPSICSLGHLAISPFDGLSEIPFPSLATKRESPRPQLPNEQRADWPDERIHFGGRIEMAKWPDGEMAKFTSAAP
jgi:hypothetical protein